MLGYGTPEVRLEAAETIAACCCIVASDEAKEVDCDKDEGLTLLVSRLGLLRGLLLSCFIAPAADELDDSNELLLCCLDELSVFICPP